MDNLRTNAMYLYLLFLLPLFSCTNPEQGLSPQTTETPSVKADTNARLFKNNPYLKRLVRENGTAALIPDKEVFELGTLVTGEITEHELFFTNTSEQVLIISTIYASCPCAIASSYPDTTLPGDRGKIIVRFNTEGKKGAQSKTLNIVANTSSGQTTINMAATIVERIKDKTEEEL